MINTPLDDFNNANPTFVVKYVQKMPDTFDQDLLEALATGSGPDMFFLPTIWHIIMPIKFFPSICELSTFFF